MAGKAKPAKHTTKEINRKHHAAKMKNGGCGGGEGGAVGRKAPKEGKTDPHKPCVLCLTAVPGLKSMAIHYAGKHPKEDWEKAILIYQPVDEKEEEEDTTKWVDPNNYDDEDEDEGIEEESKEG